MIHCQPYQSCSLFGAMRYFSNIKNTVSLINGPTGCTFYVNNAIVRLNGYFNAPNKVEIPRIYCIDFNEKDAIVGSEKKLFLAAEELIEKYHPELLLLFNCCVSEIIGSDIESIADEISALYPDLLVIPFHTAGFKGDHKYGMRLASDLLMQYILCDRNVVCKDLRSVNILGEFDYFNRSTVELCKILRNIGIEKINYIPGKSSVSELKKSKEACLNIISCQNASRHLAELMEKELGIPWIGKANSLYGVENSYYFYKEIYKFFGRNSSDIEDAKDRAMLKMEEYRRILMDKTAVVVASTRRSLGYSEILRELGIKIQLLFSEGDDICTSKNEFMKYSHNVMYNEYANELAEKIERLNADFVFTTLPEIVAPVKYIQRPEIDYAGIEGALRLGDYLCSMMNEKRKIIIEN